MTDELKQAAQQALDALFVAYDQTCSVGRPKDWKQIKDAIDALSKALQDNAGEVVKCVMMHAPAWKSSVGGLPYLESNFACKACGYAGIHDTHPGCKKTTQPAAQATHDEDETTLRDVDPKADAFLANQQATPEPVGGQPGQAFYEAHAFAFDHRFPWESLDASVKNRYAFAESMLAKAYAARHTHAAASGRGPFGQVTVRRLSQRHAGHVDQYQFYPAEQPPYLDNVDECHTVYTHPAPGVPEGFSTTPPAEQGWYWHWNGDEDSRPIPTSVLWSGTTGTCFVSMGQLGLSEAIDCDKYGGYWLKLNEPWDALTAAQAKGADHG